MKNWITNFVQRRIEIADALQEGALGAGYNEATIILLAVLSGIAAIIWPGDHKDRKRFVELLVRFAPENLQTQNISTVMLVQTWSLSNDPRLNLAAQVIMKNYLPSSSSRIITGDDVDKSEDEILKECPNLTLKEVREFSYANLLYREVRCGLMHEYLLGSKALPFSMTERNAHISYVNVIDSNDTTRHIYFHFTWIRELVSRIACSAIFEMNDPSQWWIEEDKNSGAK